MNIFADDCARLKYDRGTVSFCLESSQSAYAGATVHLPFDAFAAMVAKLGGGVDEIAQDHATWLASLAPKVSGDGQANAPTPASADELGPKIASV